MRSSLRVLVGAELHKQSGLALDAYLTHSLGALPPFPLLRMVLVPLHNREGLVTANQQGALGWTWTFVNHNQER